MEHSQPLRRLCALQASRISVRQPTQVGCQRLEPRRQLPNGQRACPIPSGVSGILQRLAFSATGTAARGSTLIPQIGTNTGRYPRHIVDDVRLQKEYRLQAARQALKLMANFFNIANHQNIDGLGTTAYKLSGSTADLSGAGCFESIRTTPTQYSHQLQ